ncbi:hypothetical protein BJ742DRAFT_881140 [Cladochytrium replicatum]|nr:hypothetical protein BJ742DRAFT_881140 [Cladochytrium replicatum]
MDPFNEPDPHEEPNHAQLNEALAVSEVADVVEPDPPARSDAPLQISAVQDEPSLEHENPAEDQATSLALEPPQSSSIPVPDAPLDSPRDPLPSANTVLQENPAPTYHWASSRPDYAEPLAPLSRPASASVVKLAPFKVDLPEEIIDKFSRGQTPTGVSIVQGTIARPGSGAPGAPVRLPPLRVGGDPAIDEVDHDEDEAIMDADNPLMSRVQAALNKQLTTQLEKLDVEIREKAKAFKKAIKKREDIGVSLYNLQQQLVRLQAMLESADDSCNTMRRYREESERNQKSVTAQYEEEQIKWQAHQKKLEQHKQELEKVARTLRQVDVYNDELSGQIKVAKRTTLKAEEDIRRQEAEKKRQDYFINHLTEQLRSLQERRALYETQLVTQQRETKAATDTLQEAATEMEAIQFEKKQLLHQWKSTLIALQRREQSLEASMTQISKHEDQLTNMTGEINGFKHSLHRTQEENETLTLLLNRLEGEVEHLKRLIAGVSESRNRLHETYMMFSKTLAQTEQELSQVLQERQALQLEMSAVTKHTTQVVAATQKLESEIAEQLQMQLSIEKGSQGAAKDSGKVRQQMHARAAAIATTQNELSAISLENLSVMGRISGLRSRVAEVDKEMRDMNDLIEKYELEIRRGNDEVGKKQGEMDALNKKWEMFLAKNLDESVGPLEATIHSLSKSVAEKEKECAQLQQYWLRCQNELVGMTKKTADLEDEIEDLKMRRTVLTRRKMVVNSQFDTELQEIREHQRNIRALQNEMVKINTLLSKHANVQAQLEENNLGLEQEFRAKLKRAELDAIHLQDEVERLTEERERALAGILESERQLMLWEKKIQLAKETQAALDPTVGATEIRDMTAEIHRMKLRYASLLKVQEKLIVEMEKSVERRESISIRTKTRGRGGGQAALEKLIAELNKKLRMTANDVKECENEVVALRQSRQRVESKLGESQVSIQELTARETSLLEQVQQLSGEKQVDMTKTLLLQKQTRRYTELLEGRYVSLSKSIDERTVDAGKMKDRLLAVDTVAKALESEFGENVKEIMVPIRRILDEIALPLTTTLV